MPLFTDSEKQALHLRFKYGGGTRGSILIHTMKESSGMLEKINEQCPELYNQTNAAYRLVRRGLVTTSTKFNHVGKVLLKKEK